MKSSAILFLIAGAALLLLSTIARALSDNIFYGHLVKSLEGKEILSEYADLLRPFTLNLVKIVPVFLREYSLSAYLLLLPAIILLTIGFSKLWYNREKRTISSTTSKAGAYLAALGRISLPPVNNKINIVLVFIAVSFLFVLAVHFLVLMDFPFVTDEFSYLFQADLLSSGKLYAQSPPAPRAFIFDGIISDGKWYSKYTLGWPLLLALGGLVGVQWAVGSLCAALSLLFLYLISMHIFGSRAGLLGIVFAILSPTFVFLGASYFPHTAFGLLALIFIYGLLKLGGDKRLAFPLATGLAILLALNVRLSDAAVLLIGSIPLGVYLFRRSTNKITIIKGFAIILLFIVVGAGLILVANYYQTGDAFVLGYQKYYPKESWGFGKQGHTFLSGLWNLAVSVMRMNCWTTPFLGLLSIFSFFYPGKKSGLVHCLAFLIFSYVIFNFGYYGTGLISFGARFYYVAFLIMAILASGGLIKSAAILSRVYGISGRILVLVFAVSSLLYMGFGVYPRIITLTRNTYLYNVKNRKEALNPSSLAGRNLILYRTSQNAHNHEFTRNNWRYNSQKNIHALFLLPDENLKLADNFRDRKAYVADWDFENDRFVYTPLDRHLTSPEDYLYAGISMANIPMFSRTEVEEVFKTGLRVDPGDLRLRKNLGILYFTDKRFENSAEVFGKMIVDFPESDGNYFYYALSQGQLGRKKQARVMLQQLTARFPESSFRDKAMDWLRFYGGSR